ncbi:MAG: hypothetical protein JST09_05315 [Bacteroidetes bacterium]|nr:hypothetical protein [Bacteroidota bacterium]
MQTVKKRFDISVTEPDKIFSKSFELDKNIVSVKGILFTSDKDDLLYYRGSQKVEINKEEIFPENYESKLLLSGINVSPNNRYYDLGSQPAGNGTIKVEYKDTEDTRAAFVPYRVSLYVECVLQ